MSLSAFIMLSVEWSKFGHWVVVSMLWLDVGEIGDSDMSVEIFLCGETVDNDANASVDAWGAAFPRKLLLWTVVVLSVVTMLVCSKSKSEVSVMSILSCRSDDTVIESGCEKELPVWCVSLSVVSICVCDSFRFLWNLVTYSFKLFLLLVPKIFKSSSLEPTKSKTKVW